MGGGARLIAIFSLHGSNLGKGGAWISAVEARDWGGRIWKRWGERWMSEDLGKG